jgi:hypothetical protein
MEPKVLGWYVLLIGAAVGNISLYCIWLLRLPLSPDPIRAKYMKTLRLLAAPVVVQCAWRGIFPSLYLQRFAFWDTQLNAILVDRTFACVGELSWNLMLAVCIMHINHEVSGQRWIDASAVALFVAYVIAEGTSYYNTATTNELWAAIEVAIDALSQLLAAPAALALWVALRRQNGLSTATANTTTTGTGAGTGAGTATTCAKSRPRVSSTSYSSAAVFVALFLVGTVVYNAYNFSVEVPMYLERYREDQARGKPYLPFWDGLVDAWRRRIPTQRLQDWRQDMTWMVLYFVLNPFGAILLARSAPSARVGVPRTPQVSAIRVESLVQTRD